MANNAIRYDDESERYCSTGDVDARRLNVTRREISDGFSGAGSVSCRQ